MCDTHSISRQMCAVRISESGSWQAEPAIVPELGPGQVLIRIRASGVCFNDLHAREGRPGHEAAGEIVGLGAGVSSRRVGDRVGVSLWQTACGRCEWCQRGKPLHCPHKGGTSINLPGSHAEFMLATADATTLLPVGLSFEEAAPLFCAGYAAYSGLLSAKPKPGDRVAVAGIGGLGHLAVQYAKAAGLFVIAITGSTDKISLIRELGADEIVRNGKELQAIGGADIILGASASVDAQADAFEGIRPEGRMVVMGLGTAPLPLPVNALIMKRASIIGSQHNDRQHLYTTLDLAARGRVKPMIETYSLAEAEKARQRLASGRARFRAVIVM